MLYRNFLAMETEELLRQHPVDGAVLMGGCDKTTPATVMGGICMNLPMIFMPAGPMMRGHFGGNILGSGSDVWKYWAEKEAGNITDPAVERHGGRHRPLGRHLHDHGYGLDHDLDRRGARLYLPGAASIPAGDAAHSRMASIAGGHRRNDLGRPDPPDIIDRRSVENALVVHSATAGSTNAMIHLVDAGGRTADRAEGLRRSDQTVPVILNLRPPGNG